MADDRLKFLVQNFGGSYGGYGIGKEDRTLKPDKTQAPKVAQPGLFDKLSRVIGQTASMGASVTGAAARFVGNTAVDIAQAGYGVGKTIADLTVQPFQLSAANRNLEQLNQKEKALHEAYRAGKVSKEDYAEGLKQTREARSDINEHILKPISDGPGVKERSEDVVETAVNVLTLGGWSLAKSAGKTVAKDVAAKGIQKSLDDATNIIQNNLLRIPAAKELIARNAAAAAKREAQRAAGETLEQYMVREGKRVAVGLLIKRPLFYQQNIQDATNIYNGMVTGDYGSALKSAGWLASQMLGGGPVGWFMTQGKSLGVKLRDLSRGRGSFIDKLSTQIGNGNAAQIARYLNKIKEKAPNEFKKSEEIFRIMQETNLRVADERVDDAVQNVLRTYDQAGIPRESIHPKQFVDDYAKWHEAAQVVDALKGRKILGLDDDQVSNLVVVRWDSVMKKGLANSIEEAGDNKEAMINVLMDFAGRTMNGWGNNPNLMKQLTRIIDESDSAKTAASRIKAIPTATAMPDGLPKSVQKKLADLGYGVAVPLGGSRKTPIVKLDDTRKLVTSAIRGPREVTRSIPIDVPKELTGLVNQAKKYDNLDDFIKSRKQELLNTDKVVKKLNDERKSIVDYATEEILEKQSGRNLVKEVLDEGGISSSAYESVPNSVKRKGGASADYVARSLGFESEDDLMQALNDYVANPNRKLTRAEARAMAEESLQLGKSPYAGDWQDLQKQIDERVQKAIKAESDKLDKAFGLSKQQPRIVKEAVDDGLVFDEATEPVPAMRAIAGGLDKLGLSPQAANKVANDSLRQSLVATLSDTEIGRAMGLMRDGDVAKGGAAVLSQLQRYVESKKPVFALGKISSGKSAVTDVRMLTPREIGEALGITANDAKEVQKALLDAYTKVPLELRGLGDRVVDYAFKYNPAQKYYARIQSALRYTYNPFFRFQEQVETAVLSKMNANKFLWMQPKEKLNETVDQLTRAGFFEGNLMSAAADDVVFGRISANMTKFQKRNLAGLALTIADRKGLSVEDMVNQYPDELDDALRVIVQYPNKGILASSLARTLNVAFFPMRYNAKVTMLAAQKLAEMPPSVQLGVVQGFMKMKDWLQSDEGIRWQSEHADALQVFKWATPIGSIQSFYKVATGNVESAGDLGLLGGLPFGVISQILDSQGVINLNTPYIDPKTGSQFPDYVPQTARARAAVAVNDLLGTMFSFPGRTLGLPGKEATMRKMVDAFIDTNGTDFEKRFDMDNLTPLQEKWIRVLKGDLNPEAIDELYTTPAPGQFDYYTLPPMDLPERTPRVPAQVDVLSRAEVAERQPQRTSRADRVARPIVRPE